MTYEELVAECKRLRGTAERAEAEFLIFLMLVEREHSEVWSEAGCDTFEQFIKSNTLCEFGRYRMFSIGVDRVGVDAARINGAHWTIAAGKEPAPSEKALKEFAARASAFVEVNGVAPSEQASRTWRAEVFGRTGKEHATVRKVDELHRLRAENDALRAENNALKKQLKALTELPAVAKSGQKSEPRGEHRRRG